MAWYDGTTRAVELTSQTAVWYRSGKPPVIIRWVLIRDPQGIFDPQALLCTDPSADPTQILEWFVLRWQLEVTFQEVRTHLGVETQRQWSDLAIARTTPILLGLFSWTTLAAHTLQKRHPITQRTAAWYDKPSPTFVDAIALVRRHLWLASEGFSLSEKALDFVQLVDGVGDIAELNVDSDGDFLFSGTCPRHWKSPGVEQQPRMRELGYKSKLCTKSRASTNTQELPASLYHRMVDSLAYAA